MYLSNGLSVVSIDIPVLRDSKITKCIFYAKSKEGKDIAEAISNAASNKANVSSEILLKHLDEEFLNQMKRIVGKGTYRCCCGTGGSVPCFNVTAENENDASSVVDDLCYSLGYVGSDCFLS